MYGSKHHVTKKASHVALEDRQVPFTYHELIAAQKPTKNSFANRFLISIFFVSHSMFLVHPDFLNIFDLSIFQKRAIKKN